MKKTLLASVIALSITSCDVLNEVAESVLTEGATTASPALTNLDVIAGLKEALTVGITNSVDLTSVANGFWDNSSIRIPFPQEAIKVKNYAEDLGLNQQVTKFEATMNHAAEEATKEAIPIFKNAIMGMSISDGFTILNGGEGAATKFLKQNTSSALTTAFQPKIDAAISKVQLTNYWNPIITKYNTAMTFTGGEKLNPDLNDYVNNLAIEGLFKMVTIEENKIRKDPGARVSSILQKVFGSIGQ